MLLPTWTNFYTGGPSKQNDFWGNNFFQHHQVLIRYMMCTTTFYKTNTEIYDINRMFYYKIAFILNTTSFTFTSCYKVQY